MTTFQQRLLDEHNDLDEKIRKLESFLDSPKSSSIDPRQRALLIEQLEYMEEYSRVLGERIELLEEDENVDG